MHPFSYTLQFFAVRTASKLAHQSAAKRKIRKMSFLWVVQYPIPNTDGNLRYGTVAAGRFGLNGAKMIHQRTTTKYLYLNSN